MKNVAKLVLTSCIAMAAFGAQAAPIALTNQGFESGSLSGWSTLGTATATASTSVTTYNSIVWNVSSNATTMAQLNPSLSIGTIESTLGLTAGTLNGYNTNANDGSLTDGAAIYQTFSGNAGDTLSMAWDYVATDYIPFNDPAFAIIINPDASFYIEVLASIHGLGIPVGTAGHSGWQTFGHTLTQSGSHTVAFVTTNDKDTILDSVFFLDGAPGSATCNLDNCPSPVSVPEPASLALLGIGLAGLGAMRRRKSV